MRFRILFWALANVVALFALFYMLDFFGIVNYYSIVRDRFKSNERRREDAYLLEREDLKKMRASYDEREHDLTLQESALIDRAREIDDKEAEMRDADTRLQDAWKQFSNAQQDVFEKKAIIRKTAVEWNSMPPANSVPLITSLANQGEDQMILDVFEEMDAIATEEGTTSLRSYLMSQLPANIAARLTIAFNARSESLFIGGN